MDLQIFMLFRSCVFSGEHPTTALLKTSLAQLTPGTSILRASGVTPLSQSGATIIKTAGTSLAQSGASILKTRTSTPGHGTSIIKTSSALPAGTTILRAAPGGVLPKTPGTGTPVIKVLRTAAGVTRVIRPSSAQGSAQQPVRMLTAGTPVIGGAPLTVLNVAANQVVQASEADLTVGLNIEAQSETSDVSGVT